MGSHIIALALLPLARDVVEKTQGFLFVDPNLLSCCHPLLPSSTVSRGSEGSGPSGLTPFLTEWKVLLSFSHITRSQRQRPSLLQTFRSQSEVFSPLPAGGLWLAFPSEAYSVLNRKAQTSTMPSTEKMLSMLPVTIVATTEKQSSIYQDGFQGLHVAPALSSSLC